MKIIITENQSEKIYTKIYEFIDNLMPSEDVVFEFMTDDELDDEVEWGEDYLTDLTSHITAYTDDYDSIFRIYLPKYWDNEADKQKSPSVVFEYNISDQLNGLFGDKWHKPMIDWLKSNFYQIEDINIKAIE